MEKLKLYRENIVGLTNELTIYRQPYWWKIRIPNLMDNYLHFVLNQFNSKKKIEFHGILSAYSSFFYLTHMRTMNLKNTKK